MRLTALLRVAAVGLLAVALLGGASRAVPWLASHRLAALLRVAAVGLLAVALLGGASRAVPWLASHRLAALCALGACAAGRPCTVGPAPQVHLVMPRRQALHTVFLIVLENHNWSSFAGNPAAPYLNHTLLPLASHATRYYNPPGLHPSLPNYLWLEAGSNCGVLDDGPPSSHPLATTQHLVTLMSYAGLSWRAYEEGIGGTTCPLTDQYPYAVRHDPFVYFEDITAHGDPHAATCIAHIRPYGALATDLRRNSVARYTFITPDLCDDGHDACSPLNDPIKQTDAWLARAVPPILRSAAYRRGGVLFITWDEGENGTDGPIGLLALSPAAKGRGYASAIPYTHSALLRTVQEILGVRPLLGDARHAPDLRALFRTFP